MANKRTLKKHIQRVCGSAAVEVLMGLPSEISHDIVIRLAQLQTTALANATFAFEHVCRDYADRKLYNKAKHQYNKAAYAKLKADFDAGLKEIVSEINTALKSNQ